MWSLIVIFNTMLGVWSFQWVVTVLFLINGKLSNHLIFCHFYTASLQVWSLLQKKKKKNLKTIILYMKLLVSLCYGWFCFFTCFNITLFILLKNNPLKSAFMLRILNFWKSWSQLQNKTNVELHVCIPLRQTLKFSLQICINGTDQDL